MTDPNSHRKTYTSNLNLDVITAYADALGRRTTYGYDGNGRLISVTRPYGDVVSYTYDENESSARGNVTTTTWTPAGGGTTIVTHASYDSSCSYPAKCNKPNTTTDGRGNVTSYTYDNTYGVPLTVTNPVGSDGHAPMTSYSYTNLTAAGQSAPIHLLTGVSYCNTTASCAGAADQTVITIGYDAGHNLAPSTITTAAGNNSVSSTQNFSYDVYGNLATSTNPLGGVSSYFYDADRELTGVVGPDPDGSGPRTPTASRISYTPDGLVNETEAGTVTSASNFSNFSTVLQVNYAFDGADRLAQTTNTGSGLTFSLTQYAYDNANNLQCTAVRMNTSTLGSEPGVCSLGTTGLDGPDRITYRNYDAADEPYQIIEGYGSSYQRTAYTATYTSAGKLSFTTDANGNNSCYGYDGFERLNVQSYPTPSSGANCNGSDNDTYGYDGNSNLISRKFRDGTTQNYTIDADNNMNNDGTSRYLYDNLGRITSYGNSTNSLAVSYDALGRKTTESDSYGGTIYSAYDAAGDRTRLTYQDGLYINYDHDLTGKVTAIRENGATSGIGILASYGFDGLGRVTSVAYGASTGSDGIAYDNDGRISTWTHGFGGDSSKNLVAGLNYNAASQIRTRTYSNNLYEWTTGYSFENNYTVNGLNEITSTGSSSLSYNSRGSLANDGSNAYGYSVYNQLTSVSGSANATLSYDGGQRLVQTAGSSTTQFVYDGAMIVEELNASGGVLRRYVPGIGATPLLWYEGSSTGDRRWLFTDPAGSVVGVMNSGGTSDGTNTYDAYGVGASSNIGRFQYAGRPWIPEAGLYDNAARTYSPTLGRFLQTDPAGYADGLNWYAYTHDDPVNKLDPTGLGQACGGQTYDPSGGAPGLATGNTSQITSPCPGTNSAIPPIIVTGSSGSLGANPSIDNGNSGSGPTLGGTPGNATPGMPQSEQPKDPHVCSAARTAAAGLGRALSNLSTEAGYLEIGGLVTTGVLGLLEVPTAGVDTPFTAGAAGVTGAIGAIGLTAGGVGAALSTFGSGGSPAPFLNYGLGLATQGMGAAGLPNNPLSKAFAGLLGQAASLANQVKSAC